MTPSPSAPATLLDRLQRQYPTATRTTLRRMLKAGRVTVGGRPAVNPKTIVVPADVVEVRPENDSRPRAATAARRLPFGVVHEDADLLVVNKPAGLLTSTVARELRPTLLAMVREYVSGREPRSRVGLIHRLDRDASGLLVFSKNDAAYRSLKTQFFRHTVERVYLAVAGGVPRPPAGRVESRLVERADGTVYSTRQPGKGEAAVTEYEVVTAAAGRSLVRVRLETGRKHQIRVHLSERGAPIVGDVVYGPKAGPADERVKRRRPKAAGRLMLAAVRLALDHPKTGERLAFEIDPPTGFDV